MSDKILPCWSCYHYRRNGCAIAKHDLWRANAGTRCTSFDYEPGSDHAEAQTPPSEQDAPA